ncbi:septation protein A [Nitrosomonas sp. sh817]|uniref:septation protein A n=1 Tax=Nitrosomonas sp. sh817 TaxID=3070658 RepID=UPI0027DB66C5|nr:septation protein A [Nitrosomonas sp. sh817]WMJ08401.1 septation protein A [Nitrosomonas sp. sh817]
MKLLFDLFPVVLFFLAYKLHDIFVATAVAIAATFVQIGWLWIRHRQIEKMMWINLAVIMVFGGATLVFQDEMFIKWKPTVFYWLIGSVLFISNWLFSKNLIKVALEKQMVLPAAVWNTLNLSWIVFFAIMGCVNLFVAFNYSLDTWVSFKLFGATGLMLVFIVAQIIFLGKYLKDTAVLVVENTDNADDGKTKSKIE